MSKEKFKIYKNVFDEYTIKTLRKLSRGDYLDYIVGPITTGKEANVFLAKDVEGENIAIKIYKIETSNFNDMWKYIQGDNRFKNVKRQKRDIVTIWAKKEFKNLEIAGKNGINVPKPIISRNNVLIMQFIGESDIPSPKAKDIPPKNPKMWLTRLLKIINVIYNKAGLIHGDLSEYNILNYKEEPYLIDMGQCVLKNHPLALKLLKNDIKNVLIWLNRLGVKTPDVEKVYKDMLKQKSND